MEQDLAAGDPAGMWLTEDGEAKIKVAACGNAMCGSIAWLEDLLLEFKGSLVVITHDRAFLDRIATRIIELDRGRLLSYPGNYTLYRTQKDEQLAQEAVISAKADKLLAGEEVWVRKGVEARRTRSQR
mgnify:CR=1 FL=1